MAPSHQARSRSRRAFLGSVFAVGTSTVIAGCVALEQPTEGDTTNEPTPQADTWHRSVYEASVPSLVDIATQTALNQEGRGSGFRLDAATVVTNAHVVGNSERVDVRGQDLVWGRADVLATDVYSDLAVLELDEPVDDGGLEWAASGPDVGDPVLALGAPLGFAGSASTGIVSGVNRSLPSATGFAIPASIQTDAPIDPGSSGGPLLNQNGAVVGVVFAGAGENIGFAISAAACKQIVPTLASGGTYEHTYVGIAHRNVTPGIADAHDLDRPRGIYVDEVLPGSPASDTLRGSTTERMVDGESVNAGGDIILDVDGVDTPTGDHLGAYLLLETDPGQTITFTIFREGEEDQVDLTLDSRPDPEQALARPA